MKVNKKTLYITEDRSAPIDLLQQAVDLLDHRGGTIYIREGLHYSAPLVLKSGIHLQIDRSAEIRFIDDFSLYPPVLTRWEGTECYALQSMIFAEDSTDIKISGEGVINGLGHKWWGAYKSLREGRLLPEVEEVRGRLAPLNKGIKGGSGGGGRETDFLRPSLIQFKNCKDVIINGVTLQNSPFWNTHILYSKDVTLKNITFRNPAEAPNTDGLDIDSSQNINIEDCHFDVGDDCLCLKSGMDENGIAVNRKTSNITIKGCTMNNGHGAIVLGSETSGGIRNVNITDCRMTGTDRGIRIKTRRGRGGTIENIKIKNIVMKDIAAPIVINMYYRCGAHPEEARRWGNPGTRPFNPQTTPVIKNIEITGVKAVGVNSSSAFILGLPESPIQNLRIKDFSSQSRVESEYEEPAMDFFHTRVTSPEILYKNLKESRFENISIDKNNKNNEKELILREELQC